MDDRHERDLWLLAIGVALADEKLRARLTGLAPVGLGELVAAIEAKDAAGVWKELKRWGVEDGEGARAGERIMEALERTERRRARWRLIREIEMAEAAGFEDVAAAKIKELEETYVRLQMR